MDGMPYSYNKAIADHPDMKEFIEGVWMAGERKMARIAALEARLARVEELARAPLIEGEGAHMQRLVAIRVELGIMPL